MSGFEDYQHQFSGLDTQIAHFVAICGLPLQGSANREEIEALLRQHSGAGLERARDELQALLILRIRLETEMIELGYDPPVLNILPPTAHG